MKIVWLAALLALPLFPTTAWSDDDGEDEAMAVAHRYGMESLERIEGLKFTYNVRVGTVTSARAWTWSASSGEVTLDEKEGRHLTHHTYRPKNRVAADARIHALYLNDRAWLFFPSHIANDRGLEVIFDEDEALPLPPGRSGRLTVDYADGSNDIDAKVFELYIDADHVIRQWTLRSDWKSTRVVAQMWEDHAMLGPVLVSLRRRGAQGEREVWFSDVEARLRGTDAWVKPAPVAAP